MLNAVAKDTEVKPYKLSTVVRDLTRPLVHALDEIGSASIRLESIPVERAELLQLMGIVDQHVQEGLVAMRDCYRLISYCFSASGYDRRVNNTKVLSTTFGKLSLPAANKKPRVESASASVKPDDESDRIGDVGVRQPASQCTS